MENFVGNISLCLFVILEIIIVLGIIIKLVNSYFFKEKQENAVVINKECYDKQIYNKAQAPYTKKVYVVTFECKNKKRYFEVNELSFYSYKKGQKGILKYKGNRLIDFK